MTISADLMKRLRDLGCDMETVVLAARYIEWRSGNREIFHAILDGFDHRTVGDSFPAFFTQFVEALGGIPEPRLPANDQAVRMSTGQRRAAYAQLATRDGECCAECNIVPSTIWRPMGVWASADGGKYTKVHPTSNLEVDHREPLWAGGTNDLANLWLLCVTCHKRKTAHEAGQRRRA